MTWFVVVSKPRAEEQAAQQLRQQGYTVYLPQLHQRKRRKNRWQWVVEPLFPRYLFVDVILGEQPLHPIRSTIGAVDLVRSGAEPIPVPDHVIEYLRSREKPDTGTHEDDRWQQKPGDVVEIVQGPFAGLTGVFQMPQGTDRALLLVELLGRQNTITVERDALGDTLS